MSYDCEGSRGPVRPGYETSTTTGCMKLVDALAAAVER